MVLKNIGSRIAKRLSCNFSNSISLGRYLCLRRSFDDTPSRIFVDIPNPNWERYYYLFLKFFDLAGYQIDIQANPNLLLNLRSYNEFIYNLRNLAIRRKAIGKYDLYLTDKKPKNTSSNTIEVDLDYFSQDKETGSFIWPYCMHPDIYNLNFYKFIPELRNSRRTIKIFFGGNFSESYKLQSHLITQLFGKIDRCQLVSYIESFAQQDWMRVITDSEDLRLILRDDEQFEFVFVKGPRLDVADWLKVLAKTDFMLAAPGITMPFSHNVIEAMALGTIPLLEYPELFSPPLVDMHNCVHYKNEQDLLEKIELICSMDRREIDVLRSNVVDYYDNYLDPATMVEKLMDARGSVRKIYINAEQLSVRCLQRRLESGVR